MPDIDNLQISIQANASKASNALDNLCRKLDRLSQASSQVSSVGLSGVASSLAYFSKSAQTLNSLKTADFTRLCKNLTQINTINSAQLNSVANSLNSIGSSMQNLTGVGQASTQVAQMASNLAKLGGVNVQRAITNIPLLSNSIFNLMSSLSRAPQVSSNVIQMTNALANLSSQGQKIGSATQSINNNLMKTSSVARATSKNMTSLAAAFGKFYANCFLIIRGVKGVWKSIQSAMDYTEVSNYFTQALGQVTSNIVNNFGTAGEESADAYMTRFRDKLEKVQAQMSGFTVSDTGLTKVSGINLGLDTTELTNYQATFLQMASSMGTTAEQANKLSEVLVKIGADLASVKNLSFNEVWGNMASGLVGMSRTLDKYGVNIRNANLQTELTRLGIDATIQKLNQNEKALLRTIVLLNSTKFAYGDLAETLYSPANQLRQLQANFQKLGMIIGSFFVPIVTKAMTYLNGLAVALQNVLMRIGALIGIDFKTISNATGSASDNMSDLLDSIYDAEDALDGATSSAKKLKNTVNGIDELNINNPNSGSTSGMNAQGIADLDKAFNDAVENYLKQWQDAYKNVEDKIGGIANRIQSAFDKAIDYIKNGNYFELGKWIGEKIGKGINKFFSAITSEDIAEGMNHFTEVLWGFIVGAVKGFSLKQALEDAGNFLDNLKYDTLLITFGTVTAFMGATALVDALKKALVTGGALGGITFASGVFLATMTIKVAMDFIQDAKGWKKNIDTFGWDAGRKLTANTNSANPYNGSRNQADETFRKWWEESTKGLQEWSDNLDTKSWESILKVKDNLSNGLSQFWEDEKGRVSEHWNNYSTKWDETIAPWFTVEKWQETSKNIKIGINNSWDDFVKSWEESGVNKWITNDVAPYFTKEKWSTFGTNAKNGIKTKWTEFTDWWHNTGFYLWWKSITEKFDKKSWTFEGIKEGLSSAWEGAIDAVKQKWNKFADFLNEKLNFEIKTDNVIGEGIAKLFGTNKISWGNIPKFATGGFPEDGLFYANHNELVGSFSNGKTAVANNEQIVSGIQYGVKSAVQEVLQPYLEEIARNTRETADKDMSFNIDGREMVSALDNRRNRNGYAFT